MHSRTARIGAAVAIVFLASASGVMAAGFSEIPSYYTNLSFNLTSPTAYTTAVGGYANPAVYSIMPGSELETYFANPNDAPISGLTRWGLFTGLKNLGFGFQHERTPNDDGSGTYSVTDYRLALSGGTRGSSFGVSVGWSSGNTDELSRTTVMQVGVVQRFSRWVSLGMAGIFSTEVSDQAGLFDLAYRPMGDDRLTVFGDLEYPKGYSLKDSPWSVGAMLEVPSGVKLIGRYYDSEVFSVALAYTFGGPVGGGGLRGSAQPFWNDGGSYRGTNWGVRVGYAERNSLMDNITRDSQYLQMRIKGPVRHTRFRYFDDSMTLASILASLEGARTDSRVAGVALNLSGMRISRGNAWEVREKLAQLQREGKHVVIYIDQGGMTQYHLASVADRVVMDPEGIYLLAGYAMSRTYITNLAEKLGIGIEEFRFKDYKSAMESFVRHEMSPEDREQRQALVDEYYHTMRSEVAASRGVEESTVDRWINDITIISPQTALDEGMVDKLGRWADVREIIRELEGDRKGMIGARSLAKFAYPSKTWGERPQVAVVYAIGECAMDTGIRARQLEKIFDRLARDRQVKAVVFRVNSPGGSPLASDVVAGAMRRCKKYKPIIVSQGDVAASGGYWISTPGEEILAQPTTITGSIGVIGGWVWDDGISEKIGLESDFVKAGEHADAFVSVRFPWLPMGIPYRRLDDNERKRVLAEMEAMYNRFVASVADARGMTPAATEEIAKGRVWTGVQGLDNGLIDRIGGLEAAVKLAMEKAGLEAEDDVEVVQLSTRGLFDLSMLRPDVPIFAHFGFGGKGEETGVEDAAFLLDYDMFYLQQISANNGRPRCILAPEYMPKTDENDVE